MSTALAICGSNPTGETAFSCALRIDEVVHAAASAPGERGDLATLVAGLCAAHAVAPTDLRELRIDLGPGSYTGLRGAITFARTLADFDALPTMVADTLALLAAAAGPQPASRRVLPVLDARRERWHRGVLQWSSPHALRHVTESAALPWEVLCAQLADDDLVVAPAALVPRLQAMLSTAGSRATCMPVAGVTAAALFDERLPLERCSPEQLAPRYLMGSYAEPQ